MSTLVTIQDAEDKEQSLCDWPFLKLGSLYLYTYYNTATHEWDTSSPVSFVEDAGGVDGVDETITEVSGAQSSSSFLGQRQANDSCSSQPHYHTSNDSGGPKPTSSKPATSSEPGANTNTSSQLATSRQLKADYNTSGQLHQISAESEANQTISSLRGVRGMKIVRDNIDKT